VTTLSEAYVGGLISRSNRAHPPTGADGATGFNETT
jgi:hypothetical protein